jgi:hypothetical protein
MESVSRRIPLSSRDPALSSIGRPEARFSECYFSEMIGEWASGRSDGSDSPPLSAPIIQIPCDTPPLAAGSFINKNPLIDPGHQALRPFSGFAGREASFA